MYGSSDPGERPGSVTIEKFSKLGAQKLILGEKPASTSPLGLVVIACVGVRGDENDANGPGEIEEPFGKFKAIAIRKPDIGEHRCRTKLIRPFERLAYGVRLGHLVSPIGQDPNCQAPEAGTVINDKHSDRTHILTLLFPLFDQIQPPKMKGPLLR
jgi:hypothetical protein